MKLEMVMVFLVMSLMFEVQARSVFIGSSQSGYLDDVGRFPMKRNNWKQCYVCCYRSTSCKQMVRKQCNCYF
ncbi:hypothetical protein AC249_AIPGENE8647 [Exaiptasia diaphana]|nr:hypothetical protein AC249_AIPGENE8647 [Exaiptasia diaphana]